MRDWLWAVGCGLWAVGGWRWRRSRVSSTGGASFVMCSCAASLVSCGGGAVDCGRWRIRSPDVNEDLKACSQFACPRVARATARGTNCATPRHPSSLRFAGTVWSVELENERQFKTSAFQKLIRGYICLFQNSPERALRHVARVVRNGCQFTGFRVCPNFVAPRSIATELKTQSF
jgi:hypothetical protein